MPARCIQTNTFAARCPSTERSPALTSPSRTTDEHAVRESKSIQVTFSILRGSCNCGSKSSRPGDQLRMSPSTLPTRWSVVPQPETPKAMACSAPTILRRTRQPPGCDRLPLKPGRKFRLVLECQAGQRPRRDSIPSTSASRCAPLRRLAEPEGVREQTTAFHVAPGEVPEPRQGGPATVALRPQVPGGQHQLNKAVMRQRNLATRAQHLGELPVGTLLLRGVHDGHSGRGLDQLAIGSRRGRLDPDPRQLRDAGWVLVAALLPAALLLLLVVLRTWDEQPVRAERRNLELALLQKSWQRRRSARLPDTLFLLPLLPPRGRAAASAAAAPRRRSVGIQQQARVLEGRHEGAQALRADVLEGDVRKPGRRRPEQAQGVEGGQPPTPEVREAAVGEAREPRTLDGVDLDGPLGHEPDEAARLRQRRRKGARRLPGLDPSEPGAHRHEHRVGHKVAVQRQEREETDDILTASSCCWQALLQRPWRFELIGPVQQGLATQADSCNLVAGTVLVSMSIGGCAAAACKAPRLAEALSLEVPLTSGRQRRGRCSREGGHRPRLKHLLSCAEQLLVHLWGEAGSSLLRATSVRFPTLLEASLCRTQRVEQVRE
mmetsp:Transcript_82000/g.265671  ORF Transcript_82000/g.265671 Transcript_82000/m.265671 type:complete len:605 (-) Transcript_82000:563-2377(-)